MTREDRHTRTVEDAARHAAGFGPEHDQERHEPVRGPVRALTPEEQAESQADLEAFWRGE